MSHTFAMIFFKGKLIYTSNRYCWPLYIEETNDHNNSPCFDHTSASQGPSVWLSNMFWSRVGRFLPVCTNASR